MPAPIVDESSQDESEAESQSGSGEREVDQDALSQEGEENDEDAAASRAMDDDSAPTDEDDEDSEAFRMGNAALTNRRGRATSLPRGSDAAKTLPTSASQPALSSIGFPSLSSLAIIPFRLGRMTASQPVKPSTPVKFTAEESDGDGESSSEDPELKGRYVGTKKRRTKKVGW